MNKKIKNFFKIGLIFALFLTSGGFILAADVHLTIRDTDNIVFSGTVSLPTSITSLNDSGGDPHPIDPNSVLAIISGADETSSAFNISNLSYFSSFGSLYLKCINYSGGEKCDNWQYVVNGSYPFSGMDQNIMSGGENIYVYFGPQNQVLLSANNITTNTTLSATAQKYDYENGAWLTRTGVTIGLTQPDPLNPFSPTEIQIATVDENGQANFSAIPVGNYDVGIKEDYYFPTKPLTVTTPPPHVSGSAESASCCTSTTPTTTTTTVKTNSNPTFDLKKAFEFIVANQKENGSFGEDLYTDWTALALASGSHQEQVIKIIKYLGESKIENAILTDYERRAMALMALGLNPYNTNGQNYIEKIISSFDGKQFGDPHENNDDTFALIVLQNAGYTLEDKMIADGISFVLGAQNEDGSWNNSIDMTGASIEALSAFKKEERVRNALIKGMDFLKKNQKENGGWDNASSTAWALEGILAMNEKPEDWRKNGNNPLDYLSTLQDTDGGIKNLNVQQKIWETVYVSSVLTGKTWNQIMQNFEKPKEISVIEKTKIIPQKIIAKKITATPKVVKSSPATKTETDLLNQNVATAIYAIDKSPVATEEKSGQGWFSKILKYIFGGF